MIGAGGDQSYASVLKAVEAGKEAVDHRCLKQTQAIETLTDTVIKQILDVTGDAVLDQEFLEKVETIFQHPACLNGSLLLPSHKPCTSKNEGIDIAKWKETLDNISKTGNDTIRELITTALSSFVLPNVVDTNPPDVETLRIFITLPLFSDFKNPDRYLEIHDPFVKAFISLPKPAFGVVEKWLANQNKVNLWTSFHWDYCSSVARSAGLEHCWTRSCFFCLLPEWTYRIAYIVFTAVTHCRILQTVFLPSNLARTRSTLYSYFLVISFHRTTSCP